MKLSIIIVNYNVCHYLYQCLDSVIRATQGMESEIFVVDNHSRDNSVSYLRPRFPQVKFIESSHNLGFARANNMAIRQSKGDYVLLLNPDTIVGELSLREAVEHLDLHEDAGAVGVRMLHSDGTNANESRRGLPTPMTAFWKMCGMCKHFPKSHRFGRYYMGWLPWDQAAEIEIVSGAFCMLRREAIDKVGLLDEDFFMFGEDIDLSYRLLKGGFKNWYVPTTILHYKGESTQKTSFRYVHVFYQAMFIFFSKHFAESSFLIALPIKMAIYLKAFTVLLRMTYERAYKLLGFFSRKKHPAPQYLFFAPQEHHHQLHTIVETMDLKATFVAANEQSMPDGHHLLPETNNPSAITYAVYDTTAYSYAAILSIFSRQPMENVIIGTFHPKTNTIITAHEVIHLPQP